MAGLRVQERARLRRWVEPCSCVMSTVIYVSVGVGGTVVQVVGQGDG